MNLLPLLLGFVLIGSFKKHGEKQNGFDLSQILSNPDIVFLLPNVAKLFDKTATEEDKNTAMMALLTNPVIFEIVQKFAGKNQNETQESNNSQKEQQASTEEQTRQKQDECKQQEKQQTFSDESKEFFAPIKDVADKQISKKLYALYDNWYVTK